MPGSISKDDGWRRYESKFLDIAVLDAAGVAVNLTGKVLRFLVRRQAGATTLLLEKTTAAGTITITGTPTPNIARVTFTGADYANLPPDVYSGMLWSNTDNAVLWPRPEETGDLYLGAGKEAA